MVPGRSRERKPVSPGQAPTRVSAGTIAARAIPAFAGMAFLIVASGGGSAAEAPAGATSCSGCHAASSAVHTPVPPLAQRPAPLTITAMQQFRSGQRPATVMDRIAKGFTEDEIAAIAAWYAAQRR